MLLCVQCLIVFIELMDSMDFIGVIGFVDSLIRSHTRKYRIMYLSIQ